MKFLIITAIILSAGIISGCAKQQKTRAKIIERKHLQGNKLQLKYQFTAQTTQYTDSIIVDNDVIESDSLTIELDTKNPGNSKPMFTIE